MRPILTGYDKMKKLLILMCGLWLTSPMNAQFFNRLINAAKKSAEDAIEQQVNKKVEEGIDKAFNPEFQKQEQQQEQVEQQQEQPQSGWTCPSCGHKGNTGKFCNECGAKKPGAEAPAKPKKQVETSYAKTDFVPGDEIFFDDPVEGEKVGEFPSHWDFVNGEECEIITLNGEQVIKLSGWYSIINPLMKEADYLPEDFTIEFDVWSNDKYGSSNNDHIDLLLGSAETEELVVVSLNPAFNENPAEGAQSDISYSFRSPAGDPRQGLAKGESLTPLIQPDSWLHVAVSFNKRAFKYYVNGVRMINLPNVMRPTRMALRSVSNCEEKDRFYLKNIRMAKGAVPLYDRLMSEGKIITYAITFDIGKANIKPESMTEINRIAQLMKDNGDLKFEVQGHTDNTGTVAGNQKLSEQRAQAIVNKLVEMGIAANRLSAKGMGQSAPLADNSTDEGRAKNRRVEFVKK